MKIAIVGSREFPQLNLVEWFIKDLPKGVSILSGGARGVDQFAAKTARALGFAVEEILPDLNRATRSRKYELTDAYYARNQQLVDAADLVIAFTEKQAGGTWDTIKRARRAGKPVKIIKPSLFFPGNEREQHIEPSPEQATLDPDTNAKRARAIGRGPFQIKRVSLGSYALKLWRYVDPLDWADWTNAKDTDPEKCAAMMLPDFVEFFKTYSPGKLHAITQAPKSKRHLNRVHPMDIVCKELAQTLNVPYVELFHAWDKRERGRQAHHPDIAVTDDVKDWLGKVVYVLDDVTTTNKTLQAAVGALLALEIHAHAVAWCAYT